MTEFLSSIIMAIPPFNPYPSISEKTVGPKVFEFDPVLGLLSPFIGLGVLAVVFAIKNRVK